MVDLRRTQLDGRSGRKGRPFATPSRVLPRASNQGRLPTCCNEVEVEPDLRRVIRPEMRGNIDSGRALSKEEVYESELHPRQPVDQRKPGSEKGPRRESFGVPTKLME